MQLSFLGVPKMNACWISFSFYWEKKLRSTSKLSQMKMPALLYEKSVRIKEVTMNTCLLVTIFLLLKLRAYRKRKKLLFLMRFSISYCIYPPTSRSANFTTERVIPATSKKTATSFIFVDTFSMGNVDFFHVRGPITSRIAMH